MRSVRIPFLIIALAFNSAEARTSLRYVGADIPQEIDLHKQMYFSGSDTLLLNGRLLENGDDYYFDTARTAFVLSATAFSSKDTLVVSYHESPLWLKSSYGRPLPEPQMTTGAPADIPYTFDNKQTLTDRNSISISGAKTFRFTSQTSGASGFSQSLDLQLEGELTPGMSLTGSVSDRGYDPTYGFSNSRLSELDKINLKLSSSRFKAEVGDVVFRQSSLFGSSSDKRLSGALMSLDYPNWSVDMAAARPRGRFESFKFYGEDNKQGPYQIGGGIAPIVPGSETVWMDGQQLSRGANDDYTMDYPSGRVTFNVNRPIDRRSRIEIDFEPASTNFKGELYSAGSGVYLADSSLKIKARWLREGDDPDQAQTGAISDSTRDLLASVGDNTSQAVVSGIRTDSLGNYDQVIIASPPDTFYQYVGEKQGDYSITFCFFGKGAGNYSYIGSNRYEYVGSGNGDYRPEIVVPAPQRADYYLTDLEWNNPTAGSWKMEFKQSRFDENLYSPLDDFNNDAEFYRVSAFKDWGAAENRQDLSIAYSHKKAGFQSRERLYQADFVRLFFLPQNRVFDTDERVLISKSTVSPLSALSFSPHYSQLTYAGRFNANAGGLGTIFKAYDWLELRGGSELIRTTLDSNTERTGEANTYKAAAILKLSEGWQTTTDYELDQRRHDYYGVLQGTRYQRFGSYVDNKSERVAYEYYVEDSLTGGWAQVLNRHRLSASSTRQIDDWRYNLIVTRQWLERPDVRENNFLGRLNLQHHSARRRLQWGAGYALSQETRNSRGITYLEVVEGQGNYRLENGAYVPDPFGNYVQVEELLSEQASVRRAEKSFNLSKTWSTASLRFNSRIEEELLSEGKRNASWIVPFWSDRDEPYLFFSHRYDGDIRLFPIKGGYFVNLAYSEDREIRQVASLQRERFDYDAALILKQSVGPFLLEEEVGRFQSQRDSYYSGAGEIEGMRGGGRVKRLMAAGELTLGVRYRKAESKSKEQSRQYAVLQENRFQFNRKGELRTSLEVYTQNLSTSTGEAVYTLTDNHPGRNGVLWSVDVRYGIKGGMRLNMSISGRHADNRSARIAGRGELVAEF